MFPTRLTLLSFLLFCACGEDPAAEAPPQYSGSFQSFTHKMVAGVPWVEVSVDGGPKQWFLLDTGAAMTVIASSGVQGLRQVSLAAGGLTFPAVQVASLDIYPGKSPCESGRPAGLLGGDLLRWFRVGLDYPSASVSWSQGGGGPLYSAVDTLPVTLAGGGTAALPGGAGEVSLHDNLPLLAASQVKVEGRGVAALVDSGATFTLVNPELIKALQAVARPRSCCLGVTLAGRAGAVPAHLTRLKQVQVGKAVVQSLPVLELPDSQFWSDLAAATGQKVELILGGTFLRFYRVALDYPARALSLSKWPFSFDPSPREFVYPGFSFCRAAAGDTLAVLDVFTGSEAAKVGIKGGDQITEIAGQKVGSRSAAQIRADLRKIAVDGEVKITLKGGVPKKARMEQALPEYK